MKEQKSRIKQARLIRIFRKAHRVTGICLFVFFFFVSTSGLLLGWKKHSSGFLLPETQTGTSSDLAKWLPLDSLHSIAVNTFYHEVSSELPPLTDRIDIRKKDGVAKFTFLHTNKEIQLDGVTGKVLQTGARRSDTLESIHDGSILDDYFNTGSIIKLLYTSIMGIGLLLFTVTGFWLWYGPKRMRKSKKS